VKYKATNEIKIPKTIVMSELRNSSPSLDRLGYARPPSLTAYVTVPSLALF
jgi:hypothetical protein